MEKLEDVKDVPPELLVPSVRGLATHLGHAYDFRRYEQVSPVMPPLWNTLTTVWKAKTRRFNRTCAEARQTTNLATVGGQGRDFSFAMQRAK